jgi:hypothetical protein
MSVLRSIQLVFDEGGNIFGVENDGTVLQLDRGALRSGLAKWKELPKDTTTT